MKVFFEGLLYLIFAAIIMGSHVDDGNVWGIYFDMNWHLLVGDFWASLLVIYLLADSLMSFRKFKNRNKS
jgi:hypothetical protein